MDYDEIADQTRKWLAVDWGAKTMEPAYLGIPRRLMIERMLINPDGMPPVEHRAFIFQGKVRFIATIIAFHDKCLSSIHTPEWKRINWKAMNESLDSKLEKPERLDEIIAVCESLCEGHDHLRVDFYDDGTRLYVGEITVYTWSGLQPLTPQSADADIGEYWTLERAALKAAAKIARCKWGEPFRL